MGDNPPFGELYRRLLYDVDDVIEQTRLGQSTVRKLIKSGELESVTIGRRRLVPDDALRAFVASLSG